MKLEREHNFDLACCLNFFVGQLRDQPVPSKKYSVCDALTASQLVVHGRNLSSSANISDFLRPDIVTARSQEDWNHPSDPDFVDLPDEDVPVLPSPLSKSEGKKQKTESHAATHQSTVSGTGTAFTSGSLHASVSRPPPRTRQRK